MPLASLPVSLVVLVAVLSIVLSYDVGRRAGARMTIPWRPIFQLVDHRTRCLGCARARVESELGPLLRIPPWAWGELFAMRRPLERRSRPSVPMSTLGPDR
jgi:hypothetical protein